ncbi:MAG: DUF4190 domain-containing protein [Actinomycetota bacterium]
MSWNPMQRPGQRSSVAPRPAAPTAAAPPQPYAPPAYYPPPYPYPPAYGPTGYGPPAYSATAPSNGLAVASLVLGIVGIPMVGFFGIAPILALIFGAISRGQIRRSGGRQGGNGLALAGMILGCVGILFGILLVILIIVVARNPANGGTFA